MVPISLIKQILGETKISIKELARRTQIYDLLRTGVKNRIYMTTVTNVLKTNVNTSVNTFRKTYLNLLTLLTLSHLTSYFFP